MPGETDRNKFGLTQFIRKVIGSFLITQVDYLAGYRCKVVAQNADGSLELIPQDPRIPPVSKVPIFYGLPGVTAEVSPGAWVLLEFANGDPQRRIATLWELSDLITITITATGNVNINGGQITFNGGTQAVARVGDSIVAGPYAGTITSGNPQVKA